jgi:nucleic acid-binding domain protein
VNSESLKTNNYFKYYNDMKKLLLLALSFGLLASCSKDDKNGIPPVDPNKPTDKPEDKPATALEAKDLKVADYESYRDKKEKVKLHGEIAEVTNGKSYFKLSDGTLVQIFTPTFKDLKEETSQKLKTVGQELTVVGTFTDYTLKDGTVVKEILYKSEADLTFGKTPEVKPEQPVVTLEASTATVNDYQAGKVVKLHGNIVIEGNKSYFKFSDNTLIQIFAPKETYNALTNEAKDKLKIAGQELTVVGTFTDYKLKDGSIVKEIVYEKEADLTFGKTPEAKPEPKPEQPVVTLEASTATVNDFQEEKVVKVHGTITVQVENKHKRSYFKFSDGTLIQFYVRDYEKTLSQEVRTKLETEGQEVTVKGTFKTYTKTDKKTGTKTDIRQIVYESAADLTF